MKAKFRVTKGNTKLKKKKDLTNSYAKNNINVKPGSKTITKKIINRK